MGRKQREDPVIQSESNPNANTIFARLSPNFRNFPQSRISLFSVRYKEKLEARVGIEPTNKGFADLCLTTWLPRRARGSKCKVPRPEPRSQSPNCKSLETNWLTADENDRPVTTISRPVGGPPKGPPGSPAWLVRRRLERQMQRAQSPPRKTKRGPTDALRIASVA
jgi:hypothetical protein